MASLSVDPLRHDFSDCNIRNAAQRSGDLHRSDGQEPGALHHAGRDAHLTIFSKSIDLFWVSPPTLLPDSVCRPELPGLPADEGNIAAGAAAAGRVE